MRTARHRYTEWTPLDGDGDSEFELYDLANDPKEYDNLVGDPAHQPTMGRLAGVLKKGWGAALPGARDVAGDLLSGADN